LLHYYGLESFDSYVCIVHERENILYITNFIIVQSIIARKFEFRQFMIRTKLPSCQSIVTGNDTCVCVYIYIHTHTHTHNVYVCARACTCVYINVISICNIDIRLFVTVYESLAMRVIAVYIYVWVYVYIYTHIYTFKKRDDEACDDDFLLIISHFDLLRHVHTLSHELFLDRTIPPRSS